MTRSRLAPLLSDFRGLNLTPAFLLVILVPSPKLRFWPRCPPVYIGYLLVDLLRQDSEQLGKFLGMEDGETVTR